MRKYKHIDLDNRITIHLMLNDSKSFKAIGDAIGKDCTSVSREVRNHLQFQKTGGRGRPYNACLHRSACEVRRLCDDCSLTQGHIYCRYCQCCNNHCPDFEKEDCPLLAKPPYVCNGCKKRSSCTLEKQVYKAHYAHAEYREVLVESRKGISLTEEEVSRLDNLISPLIRKGQSIHHIYVNNLDRIMVSENTLYRLVDACLFSVRNIDLPRKVRFSSRKVRRHLKVDKTCREGRTYKDFQAYIAQNPDLPVTEMDSVEGTKGGKVLLTVHFVKAELMIAFLRDANDSQSVLDAFDALYRDLGPAAFKKIMPVLLGDNGSEFSNPVRIEKDGRGSKRTRVFYCDPAAPGQKGSAERNHELIRCFIPKGKSMDFLTQEMVDCMMDNINSLTRKSLGDKCPYDAFSFLYGEDILSALGCHRIAANNVVLHADAFRPFLLEGGDGN